MVEKPKLHVFDVDGTILPGDIVERAYWYLTESEIFNPTEETQRLLHQSAKSKERWEYMSMLIDSYIEQKAGAPRKPIREAAEDIVDQALLEIYPEMEKEINTRRNNGDFLAIISGSPDVYIQVLKQRLGFNVATGSRFFHNRHIYHSSRPGESRSKEKHFIARKMALGKGAIIGAAYGDTVNDLSLLKHSSEPIAVNPQEELRNEAVKYNWRIIDCV